MTASRSSTSLAMGSRSRREPPSCGMWDQPCCSRYGVERRILRRKLESASISGFPPQGPGARVRQAVMWFGMTDVPGLVDGSMPGPAPLPPGWYADPLVADPTALRFWDGDSWTDRRAETAVRKPDQRRSHRRKFPLALASSVLVLVAIGAAVFGAMNLSSAQAQREQTARVERDVANVKLVIEALDAD